MLVYNSQKPFPLMLAKIQHFVDLTKCCILMLIPHKCVAPIICQIDASNPCITLCQYFQEYPPEG